jgi:CheY-like chemotaxis protein
MPIMDGPTTTKRMVEMMNLGLVPKVHIIGLTAFTSSQDVDTCIKAGMSDVLAKPLNLRSLREILTLIF